jgi:hypothetical protein
MSSDPRQDEMANGKADALHVPIDSETHSDDAWMEACRAELFDDDNGDSQNEARPVGDSAPDAAIKKTGDDAMSKFGHAIGALADNEDDIDDRILDYAAEMASPSSSRSSRDDAVAPHIAAAEREIERSKAGPVDIFDRIAMAAETQFDGSRGNAAQRVSELVDDRRVGTKRWTPSKTMKQRMEKLEAARAAASGELPAAPAAKAATTPEANTEAEGVSAAVTAEASAPAASAPASSQATVVSPGATEKPAPEAKAKVEAAPMTEEQTVTITRRDRHSDIDESIETTTDGAEEASQDNSAEELDADGLRVVPGARGRRRDRARKSRLDEDFEKIFDDEGKPSINSLRRKLRSGAAEEAAALAAAEAEAETEATSKPGNKIKAALGKTLATNAEDAPKKGLFSRLLSARKGKADEETVVAATGATAAASKAPKSTPVDADEDDLVAAFEESSDIPLVDDLSLEAEDADDESWEDTIEDERKKNNRAMPIIGAGGAILLGGLGWFGYKFLTGM